MQLCIAMTVFAGFSFLLLFLRKKGNNAETIMIFNHISMLIVGALLLRYAPSWFKKYKIPPKHQNAEQNAELDHMYEHMRWIGNLSYATGVIAIVTAFYVCYKFLE